MNQPTSRISISTSSFHGKASRSSAYGTSNKTCQFSRHCLTVLGKSQGIFTMRFLISNIFKGLLPQFPRKTKERNRGVHLKFNKVNIICFSWQPKESERPLLKHFSQKITIIWNHSLEQFFYSQLRKSWNRASFLKCLFIIKLLW